MNSPYAATHDLSTAMKLKASDDISVSNSVITSVLRVVGSIEDNFPAIFLAPKTLGPTDGFQKSFSYLFPFPGTAVMTGSTFSIMQTACRRVLMAAGGYFIDLNSSISLLLSCCRPVTALFKIGIVVPNSSWQFC